MKQKVLVTKLQDHLCCFLEEDGRISEIHCSDKTSGSPTSVHAGDIYIGKIKKRLPNIHAVFIEVSPGVECYCTEEEAAEACFTMKAGKKTVCVGDELVVQIKKEASKSKRPSVTTDITLTSRYSVISRKKSSLGVSSRLPKQEREELKKWGADCLDCPYGLILRTDAALLSKEKLSAKIIQQSNELSDILLKAQSRTCFTLLKSGTSEKNPVFSHVRWELLEEIITDLPEEYEHIQRYLESVDPKYVDLLRLYSDPVFPLVKLYRLEHAIEKALSPKVDLKSGGSLVIQPTEALTVIDVNTGRSVSGKQEQYLKLNLEAAKEAARQIRLRNLSGIILIDFINLSRQEDRNLLLHTMKELTASDPVKTDVIDITKLELMEITRKKIHPPLYEAIGKKE